MTDMVSSKDLCSLPQRSNDDDHQSNELNSEEQSSDPIKNTASTSYAHLQPSNNEKEIDSKKVQETELNTNNINQHKCQHTKCRGNYLPPANIDVRPVPIQNDVEYNEAISSISHLNLQEILSTVKEKLELYKKRNMPEIVRPDSGISIKENLKNEESIENLFNSTDEDFFEDALDELSVTSHLEELNLNSDDSDAEIEAITDIFNALPVESNVTSDIGDMTLNEQLGVEADNQLEKDQTKKSDIFVFGSPDSKIEKTKFNFKTDANSNNIAMGALTPLLDGDKYLKGILKTTAQRMVDNFKDKPLDIIKSGVSNCSDSNNTDKNNVIDERKKDCATNGGKENLLSNDENKDLLKNYERKDLLTIPIAGTSKSTASFKFVLSNGAKNHDSKPFVFNHEKLNDNTKNGITKGVDCFRTNEGNGYKCNTHSDSIPTKFQFGISNIASTNFNINNSFNTKVSPAFQFNIEAFKDLKSKNFTFSSNLPNKCVFKFESHPPKNTKEKNTFQLDMKESSASKETQGLHISKGVHLVADKLKPSTSGLNTENIISNPIPTKQTTLYSVEPSSNTIECKISKNSDVMVNAVLDTKSKSDKLVSILPGPSTARGSENNVKPVNSSNLSKEHVAPDTWKALNLQSKSWKNDFNKIFSNLSAETKHNTPPVQTCTEVNNLSKSECIPVSSAVEDLKNLRDELTKQTKSAVNNHAQLQNGLVNNNKKTNSVQVPAEKSICSRPSTSNNVSLLKPTKDTIQVNVGPEKASEGNVEKNDVFNFTALPNVKTRGPPRKAVRRAPLIEKSEPKARTQSPFNPNITMNPTTGYVMPIKFDNTQLQRDRNHRLNSNGEINKDSSKNIFTSMTNASQTNIKRNIIFIDLSGVTHKVDCNVGKSCLFTLKPMTASNTIVFQISETRSFECSVSIGFTSRNPETVKTFGLHGDSQKWTEQKDYWDLRPLEGLIPGDTVYTWLTKSGEVMVRRNDSDPFTLMRVIKLEKLWGFVDFGSDVREVKLFELRADKPPSPTARQRSVNETVLGECSICFDNPIDSVLYKCGHTCLCHACALDRWQGRGEGRCPICREHIYDVIKIYA